LSLENQIMYKKTFNPHARFIILIATTWFFSSCGPNFNNSSDGGQAIRAPKNPDSPSTGTPTTDSSTTTTPNTPNAGNTPGNPDGSTSTPSKPGTPNGPSNPNGPNGPTGPTTTQLPTSAGCYKASVFICKIEAAIAAKTNAYRAQQGRTLLASDEKISFVARNWSERQGNRGYIGHDGFPSSRNSVYRTEFNSPISLAGENVAMTSGVNVSGEDDAAAEKVASTFAVMWWNSSGHRANMLRSSFKTIGNGVYKTSRGAWYATQIFD
ncbi:MAG: CAP domain-containing protein, partial [Proteobacteria bacterium]|nr:CAP domain-containing protein [Pseudomonadota bacterium]